MSWLRPRCFHQNRKLVQLPWPHHPWRQERRLAGTEDLRGGSMLWPISQMRVHSGLVAPAGLDRLWCGTVLRSCRRTRRLAKISSSLVSIAKRPGSDRDQLSRRISSACRVAHRRPGKRPPPPRGPRHPRRPSAGGIHHGTHRQTEFSLSVSHPLTAARAEEGVRRLQADFPGRRCPLCGLARSCAERVTPVRRQSHPKAASKPAAPCGSQGLPSRSITGFFQRSGGGTGTATSTLSRSTPGLRPWQGLAPCNRCFRGSGVLWRRGRSDQALVPKTGAATAGADFAGSDAARYRRNRHGDRRA